MKRSSLWYGQKTRRMCYLQSQMMIIVNVSGSDQQARWRLRLECWISWPESHWRPSQEHSQWNGKNESLIDVMSSRKNGREAVRQIKNSARKDNREKSHKLKRLVELNVLVLWLLLFFFLDGISQHVCVLMRIWDWCRRDVNDDEDRDEWEEVKYHTDILWKLHLYL